MWKPALRCKTRVNKINQHDNAAHTEIPSAEDKALEVLDVKLNDHKHKG